MNKRNVYKQSKFFLVNFILFLCLSQSVFAKPNAHEYTVVKDIEWANPDNFSLTMDIYTPQTGKDSYPVVIIFHGGGWLINNKSIMDSMSIYLVSQAEYVVCNVNYRLLSNMGNTVKMNQIIEDVFGAVLWVKEHIANYGGDPLQLIVTGDSAGGHLAAMVVTGSRNLESDGFEGETLGFNPSYLPPGKTAEDIAADNGLDVQAAIISYGAFDLYSSCLNGFESATNIFWFMAQATPRGVFGNAINVNDNPEYYKAVSPIYYIPDSSEHILPPQFCLVGSKDTTVLPATVKAYVEKCRQNGHSAQYWEHAGRPHAFLDSTPNAFLGTAFTKDAIPALDRMIVFLDSVFMPGSAGVASNLPNKAMAIKESHLYPNFPNPFNPVTSIQFTLSETSEMAITIFDINGRQVRKLIQGTVVSGLHSLEWNGRDEQGNILPSGIYFYQLKTSEWTETKRMILIK